MMPREARELLFYIFIGLLWFLLWKICGFEYFVFGALLTLVLTIKDIK